MYYSKYRAKKIIIDGIEFHSIAEGKRYKELKLIERAGEIKDLILQPRFLLQEGFKDINTGKKERKIEYVADFMYTKNGVKIVEDVKGMKTVDYKIKRKLFIYKYQNDYRHIET
jgi:hypothetical protein